MWEKDIKLKIEYLYRWRVIIVYWVKFCLCGVELDLGFFLLDMEVN